MPELRRLDLWQLNNMHEAISDELDGFPWSPHTLRTLVQLRLCGFRVSPLPLLTKVVFPALELLHVNYTAVRVEATLTGATGVSFGPEHALGELVAAVPNVTDLDVHGLAFDSVEEFASLKKLRRLAGWQFPYAAVGKDLSAVFPALTDLDIPRSAQSVGSMPSTVNPPLQDMLAPMLSIPRLQRVRFQLETDPQPQLLSKERFAQLASGHVESELQPHWLLSSRKVLVTRAAELAVKTIVARQTRELLAGVRAETERAATAASSASSGGESQPPQDFSEMRKTVNAAMRDVLEAAADSSNKARNAKPSKSSVPPTAGFVAHPTALSLAFSFLRLFELVCGPARVSKAWQESALAPTTFYTSGEHTGLLGHFRTVDRLKRASSTRVFQRLRALKLGVVPSELSELTEVLAQQVAQQRFHLLNLYCEPRTRLPNMDALRSACFSSLKQLRVLAPLEPLCAVLEVVPSLSALELLRIDVATASSLETCVPKSLGQAALLPALRKVIIVNSCAVMLKNSSAHPRIGRPISKEDQDLYASDGGLAALQQLAALQESAQLKRLDWQVPFLEEDLLAAVASFHVPLTDVTLTTLYDERTLTKLAAAFPALQGLTICDVSKDLGEQAWPRSLAATLRKLNVRVQSMLDCESALRFLSSAQLSQLSSFTFFNSYVEVSADTMRRLCASLPALTEVSLGGLVMQLPALEAFGCLPLLKTVRHLRLDRGQFSLSLADAFPHCCSLLHIDTTGDSLDLRTLLLSLPKLEQFSIGDRASETIKQLKALSDADDIAKLKRNAKAFEMDSATSSVAGGNAAAGFAAPTGWLASPPAADKRHTTTPLKKAGAHRAAAGKRQGLSASSAQKGEPSSALSSPIPAFSFSPSTAGANALMDAHTVAPSFSFASPSAASSAGAAGTASSRESNPFAFSFTSSPAAFVALAGASSSSSSSFANTSGDPSLPVASASSSTGASFAASNPFAMAPLGNALPHSGPAAASSNPFGGDGGAATVTPVAFTFSPSVTDASTGGAAPQSAADTPLPPLVFAPFTFITPQ